MADEEEVWFGGNQRSWVGERGRSGRAGKGLMGVGCWAFGPWPEAGFFVCCVLSACVYEPASEGYKW